MLLLHKCLTNGAKRLVKQFIMAVLTISWHCHCFCYGFTLSQSFFISNPLKTSQLHLFPIKHRIRKIINPIADHRRQGMLASLVLHRLMLVAKDEEVNARVEVGLLLGILV